MSDQVANTVMIPAEELEQLRAENEKLIDFAASASVAYRDNDAELITSAFCALPDNLQRAINEKEEQLDSAREQNANRFQQTTKGGNDGE